MQMISYFGYGTNRDRDMMAAMIGRNNLSGTKGIIFDYELAIQNLEHIPDKILSTAPAPRSPREIMKTALGDNAKLYIIRPKSGAITHGTIWQITPEEYEMVRDWELLDFGMQEDMKVLGQTEADEKLTVQTHGSNNPNLSIDIAIDGNDYEDYVVPKEKILETARRVNKEFRERAAMSINKLSK